MEEQKAVNAHLSCRWKRAPRESWHPITQLRGKRECHRQLSRVVATSFVTTHTSTAFTFYMRCIILFSVSQRHSAWDIRSENRPIENDCLSLLARKYDKSIQSERIAMLACNENPWS